MIEKQAAEYIADGGSVDHVNDITGLEFKTVDPDLVTVHPMNMRTMDTLDTRELEGSVEKMGIVEPVVCGMLDEDAKVPYGVIQGQRRVTAAKAVGLDEIPILLGEFDELEAIERSITENIEANWQSVSTNSRANAIWRWWVRFCQDQGIEYEEDEVPTIVDVADKFGVKRETATNYVEPLRKKFAGTELDARVKLNNEDCRDDNDTIKVEEVSPGVLQNVRSMGFEKSDAVDVVKSIQKHALTQDEIRQISSRVKNDNLDMDFEESLDLTVKARQEAQDAKRSFMLKRMHMRGSRAKGLRAAESDLGKPREEVVKIAINEFLEGRGYL
jgi:ParB family chromosome partitioning protein